MQDELTGHEIVMLLARGFEAERIPRALAIQVAVAAGEGLAEEDARFLDDMVFDVARAVLLTGGGTELQRLHRVAAGLREAVRALAEVPHAQAPGAMPRWRAGMPWSVTRGGWRPALAG